MRVTDGQTDGQTEFSSLDRVCIPCSAVKSLKCGNCERIATQGARRRASRSALFSIYLYCAGDADFLKESNDLVITWSFHAET